MQMSEVDEVKEVMGVDDANLALAQGWRLIAVVPRGALVSYVLGRKVVPDEPQGEYVRGHWKEQCRFE